MSLQNAKEDYYNMVKEGFNISVWKEVPNYIKELEKINAEMLESLTEFCKKWFNSHNSKMHGIAAHYAGIIEKADGRKISDIIGG